MNVRLFKFNLMLFILSGSLLAGCQKQDRDELGILWKKRTYQSWLLQQRPFLANLPKSAIIDYDFTTLHEDKNISPVVTYDLKAGQWDGVVELWFTLKLDPKGQPIGFSEETVTFFRLPAKKTVIGKDGKKRNVYDGFKLKRPDEVADLIKRIASGGDFSDYPKQTNHYDVSGCSFFDYNDPWKNHKSK
jgi:hypothetical protein